MTLLRILFALILSWQFFVVSAFAAKEELSEQQIEELKKKAKLKQYLGGADEQDLRVQSPLLSVFRKMNPVLEPPPAEDGPSED